MNLIKLINLTCLVILTILFNEYTTRLVNSQIDAVNAVMSVVPVRSILATAGIVGVKLAALSKLLQMLGYDQAYLAKGGSGSVNQPIGLQTNYAYAFPYVPGLNISVQGDHSTQYRNTAAKMKAEKAPTRKTYPSMAVPGDYETQIKPFRGSETLKRIFKEAGLEPKQYIPLIRQLQKPVQLSQVNTQRLPVASTERPVNNPSFANQRPNPEHLSISPQPMGTPFFPTPDVLMNSQGSGIPYTVSSSDQHPSSSSVEPPFPTNLISAPNPIQRISDPPSWMHFSDSSAPLVTSSRDPQASSASSTLSPPLTPPSSLGLSSMIIPASTISLPPPAPSSHSPSSHSPSSNSPSSNSPYSNSPSSNSPSFNSPSSHSPSSHSPSSNSPSSNSPYSNSPFSNSPSSIASHSSFNPPSSPQSSLQPLEPSHSLTMQPPASSLSPPPSPSSYSYTAPSAASTTSTLYTPHSTSSMPSSSTPSLMQPSSSPSSFTSPSSSTTEPLSILPPTASLMTSSASANSPLPNSSASPLYMPPTSSSSSMPPVSAPPSPAQPPSYLPTSSTGSSLIPSSFSALVSPLSSLFPSLASRQSNAPPTIPIRPNHRPSPDPASPSRSNIPMNNQYADNPTNSLPALSSPVNRVKPLFQNLAQPRPGSSRADDFTIHYTPVPISDGPTASFVSAAPAPPAPYPPLPSSIPSYREPEITVTHLSQSDSQLLNHPIPQHEIYQQMISAHKVNQEQSKQIGAASPQLTPAAPNVTSLDIPGASDRLSANISSPVGTANAGNNRWPEQADNRPTTNFAPFISSISSQASHPPYPLPASVPLLREPEISLPRPSQSDGQVLNHPIPQHEIYQQMISAYKTNQEQSKQIGEVLPQVTLIKPNVTSPNVFEGVDTFFANITPPVMSQSSSGSSQPPEQLGDEHSTNVASSSSVYDIPFNGDESLFNDYNLENFRRKRETGFTDNVLLETGIDYSSGSSSGSSSGGGIGSNSGSLADRLIRRPTATTIKENKTTGKIYGMPALNIDNID